MKELKRTNCIVKGKKVRIVCGDYKDKEGTIIKISGYNSSAGCVFQILIDNQLLDFCHVLCQFVDEEVNRWWNDPDSDCIDFEIED
jgi:hypothetical protein